MSTLQSIPHLTPRVRIGLGTALSALGVLVAIAVTVILLALTGANHSTVATPVTASQASAGPTPQVHYLGPRQERAAINPRSAAAPPSPPAPAAQRRTSPAWEPRNVASGSGGSIREGPEAGPPGHQVAPNPHTQTDPTTKRATQISALIS